MRSDGSSLERFVPRVAAEWDLDAPGARWQQIDGTLCFVDISGFTNLSEKLARRGRIGAEELTEVLDRVFGNMLRLAYDRGGSLLKFGGDALLLMFEGDTHALQGACAAVEMRAALREATKIPTSVGRIALKMSVGLHTGLIDLFRVGGSHRELVITGAAATTTTDMEGTADAGEILISPDLAARLPRGAAGEPKGPGVLLRWRKTPADPVGPVPRRPVGEEVLFSSVPVVLRSHLGRGGGDSEHRIANVGFVKYKGIEAAMNAGGHAAVADGLDELIRAVQEAIDPEAVTFLATDIDADGGKVILTTGVPGTQEDDEGRMLRALRRVADAGTTFPLKIGVNRGHVFAGEIGTEFRSTYTVMGDTVNLAARLMAAAPPGEVYAAPAVLDRSRTLFATRALEPFYVKGKTQPVQAYAMEAETGTRTVQAHRELPFTGRDEDLATIRSGIEGLSSGTGSAITVTGDTGFGKSRLVDEALLDLERVAVFEVRSEPYGAGNPYWAFRDPIRNLLGIERAGQAEMAAKLAEAVASLDPSLEPYLPLIGDVAHIDVPDTPETAAIEPRFRPDQTAATLVRLLEAALPGPLVVVVEDGHWIDEASSSLVTMLATVAAPLRPWLVLLTTRPDGEHLTEPLGTEIALGPLSEDAARSLVIVATEAAPLRPHELETVVSRAAGNPLFLEEILRLVRETGSVEALPDSLDAVVSAEIDSLHPLSRRLLRYSSVLGRSFRRVVLEELLEPEDVALDAATRRELGRFIEAEGRERFRFRHSVMHDVAYQGLSYRKRKELHGRAGEVIERLAGKDTDAVAEFLALHYAEAGNHDKAWRYGVIAGDRAKAAFANVEADDHYRRALESVRRSRTKDTRTTLAVWRSLAEVREQAGMYEPSLLALDGARRHTSDPVDKAELLLGVARAHLRMGNYRSALRATARGLDEVDGLTTKPAGRIRARLLSWRAYVRLQQGRPGEALALASDTAAEAERHDEKMALALAYTVLDSAWEMLGEPEKAVYEVGALELYEQLGDLVGLAMTANNLGVRAYDDGRWEEAVDSYSRAREAFKALGNEPQAGLAGANLGEVLVSLRRYDDAAAVLTEASRVLRSTDVQDFAVFSDAQSARIEIARGASEKAALRLQGLVDEAFDIGHTGIALDVTIHLAAALIAAGRYGEAVQAMEDSVRRGPDVATYFDVQLARLKGRSAAHLGQYDEAGSLIDEALSLARRRGMPYEEALALDARAELSSLRGEDGTKDAQEASRLLGILGVSS